MPKAKFLATIKAGSCPTETPISELPEVFHKAKAAWDSKNAANLTKSCAALSEFLRCSFTAENLFGDLEELFIIDDDIYAEKVAIEAIDYSGDSLPTVKAIASFSMDSNGKISAKKVDDWQEENEMLDSGVTFYWEIPDVDFDDSSLSTHEGLGFHFTP